ncbi:MAG: methyltransferase domain-containing protein [Candidatus Gottesmanbacteria bacterium]|nr:methyltransferase domain-containing protein [Candidatus Gottesmanbacteria bacterium]
MNIKPTDLVLEIGSGNNPNPRSDILCDRYIHMSHDRAGEFAIHIDRPMVVADGMRLPFADKTFDYVIASHIFEHMDDPAGFAREIARVGRAGFIEVPSALSERVFGWNFHHWYCMRRDGVLTFTPKKEGEQHGGFFHRLIARNMWFRRFFEQHEHMWYTRLEWQGKIPIRVERNPMSPADKGKLDAIAWDLLHQAKKEEIIDAVFAIRFLVRRIIRKIRKIIRKFGWLMATITMDKNIISSLAQLCVCPQCHGKLIVNQRIIRCSACSLEYPMDGCITILLNPVERKKGW